MNDNFFLRASNGFNIVASSAEKALQSLNFQFLRNMTDNLVELEVVTPEYFRVVIERRTDPVVRSLILPSIHEAGGSSIDVRFDQGKSDEGVKNARLFLKTLVSLLPAPPWTGLRFRESGREKKRWLDSIG